MSRSRDILLDMASRIVAAEELARAKIVVRPEVKVTPSPAMKTVVVKRKDFKVPDTLIDVHGSGCLKELLVKSSFKEYVLRLYADGSQLYADGWDDFNEMSQEVDEISAFRTEEGEYVLHLCDVKFTESMKVVMEPVGGPRTVSLMFYKLDIVS